MKIITYLRKVILPYEKNICITAMWYLVLWLYTVRPLWKKSQCEFWGKTKLKDLMIIGYIKYKYNKNIAFIFQSLRDSKFSKNVSVLPCDYSFVHSLCLQVPLSSLETGWALESLSEPHSSASRFHVLQPPQLDDPGVFLKHSTHPVLCTPESESGLSSRTAYTYVVYSVYIT